MTPVTPPATPHTCLTPAPQTPSYQPFLDQMLRPQNILSIFIQHICQNT